MVGHILATILMVAILQGSPVLSAANTAENEIASLENYDARMIDPELEEALFQDIEEDDNENDKKISDDDDLAIEKMMRITMMTILVK